MVVAGTLWAKRQEQEQRQWIDLSNQYSAQGVLQ